MLRDACVLVLGLAAAGAVLTAEAQSVGYFDGPMLLGAHRGGRGLWPENTLVAFEKTAAAWPEAILEGDAQLTADGHVVLCHDRTVDRTTDGTGLVSAMTLAELKALDAGYRFTPDGGKSFPYRGQGVTIPTFDEVLEALPEARFLIELKPPGTVDEALIALVRQHDALDRVVVASFLPGKMTGCRRIEPRLLTCFDTLGGAQLLKELRFGDWEAFEPPDRLLAMDLGMMAKFNVTPEEIAKLRAKGVCVQLHTINGRAQMLEALELGVDTILTDYPDVLAEVLAERQ